MMTHRLLAIFLILAFLPVELVKGRGDNTSTDQEEAGVTLLFAGEDSTILEMTAPVYQSQTIEVDGKVYQSLKVPGAELAVEPGKPAMPVVSAVLGIPPGARLELVVLSDEALTENGSFNLLPSNQANPPDEVISADERLPQFDSHALQIDSIFPQSSVQVDDDWLGEQHIARLVFYPLQYQSSLGALIWHKRLRVQLIYVTDPSNPVPYRPVQKDKPSPFEALIQASLLNYEQARSWRGILLLDQVDIQSVQNVYEATGPRFKIVVDQDGLYRLTYEALHATGFDFQNVAPASFHMSSQGNDVAISVYDGGDGSFGPGDSITFYGQKFLGDLLAQRYASEGSNYRTFIRQLPDGSYTTWKPQFNAAMMEKYTKENGYWLEVGGIGGPRIATQNGTPANPPAPVPQVYTDTVHVEESNYWYTYNFSSEDTWFWDQFDVNNSTGPIEHTYPINLTALASLPFFARVRGEMVAKVGNSSASPDHHTKVWVNNTNNTIDENTWDGISRYRFDTLIPGNYLLDGPNQMGVKVFKDAYPGQTSDFIYFDWVDIEYPRRFVAVNEQITFERDEAGQRWRYQISNFASSPVEVYNITDPFNPQRVINSTFGSGTLTFDSSQSGVVDYLAAGSLAVKNPKSVAYYTPPDLKSATNSADYLIITHHDFLAAAQMLANHRAAQGLETMVVDVADLYNEFDYGIFHSIAIKNFLRYAYQNWTKSPTYVVLVGDGHWNFLNSSSYYLAPPIYIPPHLAWVDPWQGEVDSANLLAAVAGNNILPNMLIARIPVNSVAELSAFINKMIAYENGPEQAWQRHLLFVVDDTDSAGDFGNFADGIIADYLRPGFQDDRVTNKIDCGGLGLPTCPGVINNRLSSTGTLIANYIGHASINYWAESIFSSADVPSLSNGDRLPVVLSMTCLDGYWIYPGIKNGNQETPGLIETMLRASNQGAVGAFSPTGLGVATGHDTLQRGFYDALFNNGSWELGKAALSAKLRLFDTGSNFDLIQTYTVFGDPAMKIRDPYQSPGLAPGDQASSGTPGSIATYSVSVTNASIVSDTYQIAVTGNTWGVNVPTNIGPILSGASQSFDIDVAIPAGAIPGASDIATVTVSSQGDGYETTSVLIGTFVGQFRQVSLAPTSMTNYGISAHFVNYAIEVTNTGVWQDRFSISVSGAHWPTGGFPNPTGLLQPGAKQIIPVTVYIPPGQAINSSDSATLRVSSVGDPRVWSESVLTTVVTDAYKVYLPKTQR